MPGIGRTIERLVAATGLHRVAHRTLFRRSLTIVMYHAVVREPLPVEDWCFVDAQAFEHQIQYLKKRFDVVHLSEGIERLASGTIRRPTAVITFDDGYQNNCDVALPILERVAAPATVFLTTGLVGTDDTLWACRLNRAFCRTACKELMHGGMRYDLSTPHERSVTSARIQNKLKSLPQAQLIEELHDILRELGDDPHALIDPQSPYRMLDRDAIERMASSGLISFGAHAHTHAILSRLDPEECRREIERSVETVSNWMDRPCRLFAYPNGKQEDYNATAIETLKSCGIETAVTTIEGPNLARTPKLELRRYGIGADVALSRFQLVVHHASALRSIWR